ncbi:MAG: cyclodeaminase/cyclohydrolase family protein [Proteobacteria bacterium]|nr:cyclodeaminase/cyclohydrolase family protein [Pseudomonadota bacterium]
MQNSFIIALADPGQLVPGGGAAAAYAGTVGLALFQKIIGIELRRPQGAGEHFSWADLLFQVSALNESLYRLRDADGKSYMRLAQAIASGKSREQVASALKKAVDCPVQIMEKVYEALGHIPQTAGNCKGHLLSDLLVVCELLGSAGRGAYHIIRANLQRMADPVSKADYQRRVDRLYDLSCEALKLAQVSILQSAGLSGGGKYPG